MKLIAAIQHKCDTVTQQVLINYLGFAKKIYIFNVCYVFVAKKIWATKAKGGGVWGGIWPLALVCIPLICF